VGDLHRGPGGQDDGVGGREVDGGVVGGVESDDRGGVAGIDAEGAAVDGEGGPAEQVGAVGVENSWVEVVGTAVAGADGLGVDAGVASGDDDVAGDGDGPTGEEAGGVGASDVADLDGGACADAGTADQRATEDLGGA